MADHFLAKSRIAATRLAATPEGPALTRHAALREILEREAGPEVAGLFATPIMGRPNEAGEIAISWYTDHAGEPRRMSDLDGPARADVEGRLSARLQELRRLLNSEDLAPTVGAMMTVPDPNAIWAVGGQPVIADWGILPAAPLGSDEARNAHYAQTLGRFLPLANPAALFAGEGAGPAQPTPPPAPTPEPSAAVPVSVAAPGATMPAASAGGTPPPPPQPPQDTGPQEPGRRAALWPVLLLIAILALALIWLLLPETRLFPPRPTAIERQIDERAEQLAREANRALEERALALEAAIDGAVCTDTGDLILPDGRTPEGLLPPAPTDGTQEETDLAPREGNATPLIVPDPERVQVPGDDGDGDTAQSASSLLEVIDARTVLVLASNGDGVGIGTGFFIAPDLVATNHHVIADALSGGTVHVLNRDFGTVREVEVLASDGPFEQTGGDFALLRVPGGSSPFFPLVDVDAELRAQGVIAAGYPFDIMQSDQRYQQLMSGNSGAVPDMIVTDGIVNAVQQVAEGIDMVVHSAPISKGNSGGPLVDMCGRVVGMNTFIREEAFRNLNLAQANRNVLGFLRGAGQDATVTSAPCQPEVSPAAPAAAAPAPEADQTQAPE